VHECLHAVSAGLTSGSYNRFQGFEEGVVEALTRQIGPQVLRMAGAAGAFEPRTVYEGYLAALEQIRSATGIPSGAFYL
jgi:hypothetical protein